MGMFDTFYGKVKCPLCGGQHNIDWQTKDYECCLDEFLLGDYIDKGNTNYIYSLKSFCDKNSVLFDTGAVIRKGQLVKYVGGDEYNKAVAEDYDNIEDGYQRRIDYEKACKDGEGWPKEVFAYSQVPLSNGFSFMAFNTNWKVVKLFRKVKNLWDEPEYYYTVNSKEHGNRIVQLRHNFRDELRFYKEETLKKDIEEYPNLFKEYD